MGHNIVFTTPTLCFFARCVNPLLLLFFFFFSLSFSSFFSFQVPRQCLRIDALLSDASAFTDCRPNTVSHKEFAATFQPRGLAAEPSPFSQEESGGGHHPSTTSLGTAHRRSEEDVSTREPFFFLAEHLL